MGERLASHSRTRVGFPNAKVNVGLQVRNRRQDGFHAIESLFIPIPWCDTLELEVLENGAPADLKAHGIPIPGNPEHNLVLKAHALLASEFNLPSIRFHLIKSIPMGAGLGGGSSDGAAALKLMDAHFNLGLSESELESRAAKLGSDCPFFIRNTCSHVSGRGEYIQPITLETAGWWVAAIHTGLHISTAEAFAGVSPDDDRPGMTTWSGSGPEDWAGELKNDFTFPVMRRHPIIGTALGMMQDHGATFADMSGSGSAVFGFFKAEPEPRLFAACPKDWRCWAGQLSAP